METWKIGDRVQLKSGGPVMTVAFVDGFDIKCKWFEGTKTCSDTFNKDMLQTPVQPQAVWGSQPRIPGRMG